MSIKISIITPVYNAEKYILDTADSVLSQTYSDWEWILVDDCSTDDSFSILLHLTQKDKRIKVFKNDINSRAFATRNRGLKEASGDYIAFLDSDDIWDVDKLKIQLEFMIQNDCEFCYTGFKRFKTNINNSSKIISVPNKVDYKSILFSNTIATSTVMLKRDAFNEISMKDVYYDDFVLWLDLLKIKQFAYGINYCLMYYRLSDNSLSRNKFKSIKKVYQIFRDNLGLSFIKSRVYYCCWVFNTLIRYIKNY